MSQKSEPHANWPPVSEALISQLQLWANQQVLTYNDSMTAEDALRNMAKLGGVSAVLAKLTAVMRAQRGSTDGHENRGPGDPEPPGR